MTLLTDESLKARREVSEWFVNKYKDVKSRPFMTYNAAVRELQYLDEIDRLKAELAAKEAESR